MRLLFVIDSISGDGPTRCLIALAEAIRTLDIETSIDVVTLNDAAYPLTLMQCRRHGVLVHRAVENEELNGLVEAADLVIPMYWNSPKMAHFLRRSFPPMRCAPWLQTNGHHPPQTLSQRLIDLSDAMLCTAVSTQSLPELAPVTTEHLPALPNLSRVGSERPADDAPFTVTYLGTINRAKMHSDFVALSAAIDVPAVRILICGAGGGEGALAEEIAESSDPGRFQIQGFVENISDVLARSHVFGYPLKPETYATTEKSLIEAMAAGVCPVVFPHGGIKEIVRHQETGLVVEDATGYAEAVRWLFDHPDERRRLGEAASADIRNRFDPARLAQRFVGAAVDLVEETTKRPHLEAEPAEASGVFIESLGSGADVFRRSQSNNNDVASQADGEIERNHEQLGSAEGGVIHYRNDDPTDTWLRYWTGLVLRGAGDAEGAAAELAAARSIGPSRGRDIE